MLDSLGGNHVAIGGNDCGRNVMQANGFVRGEPRALGDGAARPAVNPLPDVASRALLALQIRVDGGGDDAELLSGVCLRQSRPGPEEAVEKVRGEVLSHPRRFRFMNRIGSDVKNETQIHDRERAKVLGMTGRAQDDPVTWYCHMRVSGMLGEGRTQKQIAESAQIPRSAISHLIKHGAGVGSVTAAKLVGVLGFPTRGALFDAAEDWWASEGERYAAREMRAQAQARQLRAAKSARALLAPKLDDQKIG